MRNFVKWTLCIGVIFPLFKYKFHPSHSLKHTPRIVNQCHRSRTLSSSRRKKRNKSERGDKRVHRMKIVRTMRKFRRWRGLKRLAFLARFRPVFLIREISTLAWPISTWRLFPSGLEYRRAYRRSLLWCIPLGVAGCMQSANALDKSRFSDSSVLRS